MTVAPHKPEDAHGIGESTPANARPWCAEIVSAVRAKLTGKGRFDVAWTEDGEPEIFVWSLRAPEGHGRILMGENDDGSRYAFWSYGWQGFGGAQFDCEPVLAEAVDVAIKLVHLANAEARYRASLSGEAVAGAGD